MAGKADYLENALLNCVFRGTTFPVLDQSVWIGLLKSPMPATDSGAGYAEVTIGTFNYARKKIQHVSAGSPEFGTAAVGGTITNTLTVSFNTATGGNWGTVVGIALFDAATAGNMLYFQGLTTPTSIDVNSGDQVRWTAGSLTITED